MSLPDVRYLDCELPSTRKLLEDPEAFLDAHQGQKLVLDEVHRLQNQSEVLKIAALEYRLLRGGLPPFFLAEGNPEKEYQEWLDAYWAKDILELFRLERRFSFMRFAEMLFAQSGGMFEASRFAAPCEVSRTTISNYLSVLEATYAVHLLRPFSTHRSTEIVSAPKVYAFDTGFVCFHKGWTSLRTEDLGLLWEHFVLNELQARLQTRSIHYWRDKAGHEVDFVLKHAGGRLTAIESKWSSSAFDASALVAFRRKYPLGGNFLVSQDCRQRHTRRFDATKVEYLNLRDLTEELEKLRPARQ